MNIDIIEVNRNDKICEVEYNIIDTDINEMVGYLFTVKVLGQTHIAYEVKEKYRGNNIATKALEIITNKISCPVLEITHDNMASKRVAIKAGYTLVKSGEYFEIYKFYNKKKIKQFS